MDHFAEKVKPSLEDVFTAAEAADHFRVSLDTVKRWLKAGRLKGAKVGRAWRISRKEIERHHNV